MQKFAHKERKCIMKKIDFATLEEQQIFFDNIVCAGAFISQRHNGCMKGAYYNGTEVKKRYFTLGFGVSINAVDYMCEGMGWSTIGPEEFENSFKLLLYLPIDVFDTIEMADGKRELIYFDLETGKGFNCTAEFQQCNYGVYYETVFRDGQKVILSKRDYEKKFIFLDPRTDRRLFPL
jgi:hypothetical protein